LRTNKARTQAPIVAVLVVLGALGTMGLITVGSAHAASTALTKDPCSVTVFTENLANNAVQTAINTYPGGTICLGAGTFPEQLTISSSGTTLKGAGATMTFLAPTSVAENTYDDDLGVQLGSTGMYAIILVGTPCLPGPCSSLTQVTGVTVEGLTINGALSSSSLTVCGNTPQAFVGVDFQDSSGTLTSAKVVNIATSYPCNPESAVYATNGWFYTGTPVANTITVSHSTMSGYMKNGISCDDPWESCSIVSNTVTGSGPNPNIAQNGIQVAFGAFGTVTSNTISGNDCTWSGCGNDYYTATQATGILLYDPATGTTVSSNTATLNQVGILFVNDGSLGAVSVTISHNTVKESYAYGIVANGAPGGSDKVTIHANTVNNKESLNPSIWGAPGILVDTGTFHVTGNNIYGSSTALGSSNGASQSDAPGSLATSAIQGASESSTSLTTLYISGNSYSGDSFRLVTLGEGGGSVNVEEAS
jgi:hypothetical protein